MTKSTIRGLLKKGAIFVIAITLYVGICACCDCSHGDREPVARPGASGNRIADGVARECSAEYVQWIRERVSTEFEVLWTHEGAPEGKIRATLASETISVPEAELLVPPGSYSSIDLPTLFLPATYRVHVFATRKDRRKPCSYICILTRDSMITDTLVLDFATVSVSSRGSEAGPVFRVEDYSWRRWDTHHSDDCIPVYEFSIESDNFTIWPSTSRLSLLQAMTDSEVAGLENVQIALDGLLRDLEAQPVRNGRRELAVQYAIACLHIGQYDWAEEILTRYAALMTVGTTAVPYWDAVIRRFKRKDACKLFYRMYGAISRD